MGNLVDLIGRKIQDNDNRFAPRTGEIVGTGRRPDGKPIVSVKWSSGRTTQVVVSMLGKQSGTRGYRFIDTKPMPTHPPYVPKTL